MGGEWKDDDDEGAPPNELTTHSRLIMRPAYQSSKSRQQFDLIHTRAFNYRFNVRFFIDFFFSSLFHNRYFFQNFDRFFSSSFSSLLRNRNRYGFTVSAVISCRVERKCFALEARFMRPLDTTLEVGARHF